MKVPTVCKSLKVMEKCQQIFVLYLSIPFFDISLNSLLIQINQIKTNIMVKPTYSSLYSESKIIKKYLS